jgi:dCMP deaminase
MFPCNECAKLLIQAGITEVIFHENKPSARPAAAAAAAVAPGAAVAAAAQQHPEGAGRYSSAARAAEALDGFGRGPSPADGPDAAAMAARLAGSGDEDQEEVVAEGEDDQDDGDDGGRHPSHHDQHSHPHPCGHHPCSHAMSPEDAVYAASRRLLALAGVKVRQHALQRHIALPSRPSSSSAQPPPPTPPLIAAAAPLAVAADKKRR